MHRGYRYLSSLFLAATLAAPVAMMAAATPQERDRENRQGENNKRYYDRNHKDYHNWDRNEDRAYHQYQTQHHRTRDFDHSSKRQQNGYWNWRHNNPDKD